MAAGLVVRRVLLQAARVTVQSTVVHGIRLYGQGPPRGDQNPLAWAIRVLAAEPVAEAAFVRVEVEGEVFVLEGLEDG